MVFQCLVRPWLQKLVAVFLAANSFMLVWSEATIGSGQHPDLSPFSHVRFPPSTSHPQNQPLTISWHHASNSKDQPSDVPLRWQNLMDRGIHSINCRHLFWPKAVEEHADKGRLEVNFSSNKCLHHVVVELQACQSSRSGF